MKNAAHERVRASQDREPETAAEVNARLIEAILELTIAGGNGALAALAGSREYQEALARFDRAVRRGDDWRMPGRQVYVIARDVIRRAEA